MAGGADVQGMSLPGTGKGQRQYHGRAPYGTASRVGPYATKLMLASGAGCEADDMASVLMTGGVPLGAALTLVGLICAFFVWLASGGAAGLRGVSWSLVPLVA